jgi:hypothetical protein
MNALKIEAAGLYARVLQAAVVRDFITRKATTDTSQEW